MGEPGHVDKQPQLSIGSAHHDGTGRCKPCGFYWSARGCASGANCRHCHLCPKGERERRKREGGVRGAAAQPLDAIKLAVTESAIACSVCVPSVAVDLSAADDNCNCSAPSLGSQLHDGSERCRPCGFFWTAQGCIRGAECGHCHVCPKGERERRKRFRAPRGDKIVSAPPGLELPLLEKSRRGS